MHLMKVHCGKDKQYDVQGKYDSNWHVKIQKLRKPKIWNNSIGTLAIIIMRDIIRQIRFWFIDLNILFRISEYLKSHIWSSSLLQSLAESVPEGIQCCRLHKSWSSWDKACHIHRAYTTIVVFVHWIVWNCSWTYEKSNVCHHKRIKNWLKANSPYQQTIHVVLIILCGSQYNLPRIQP